MAAGAPSFSRPGRGQGRMLRVASVALPLEGTMPSGSRAGWRRGAARGGQWIPALPWSLARLSGPSAREPDAVTSQGRTVPAPRAMDRGGGGGRRVWKFIRTPFRQTAQH